ncbi:MAG: hypothetical protein AB1331_09015 [Bacillota bacterium]
MGNEERKQVLQMLQEGKITAEEAEKLLNAVEPEAPVAGREAKWFRIRVFEQGTGKTKVNVNLPVSLLDLAMKFVPKHAVDIEGLDIRAILDEIKKGAMGKIVEVEDEDEGVRVEIVVE